MLSKITVMERERELDSSGLVAFCQPYLMGLGWCLRYVALPCGCVLGSQSNLRVPSHYYCIPPAAGHLACLSTVIIDQRTTTQGSLHSQTCCNRDRNEFVSILILRFCNSNLLLRVCPILVVARHLSATLRVP